MLAREVLARSRVLAVQQEAAYAKRQRLGEKEVGKILSRFSWLYLQAASSVKTKKQAADLTRSLCHGLNHLSKCVDPNSTELAKFFADNHGIDRTTHAHWMGMDLDYSRLHEGKGFFDLQKVRALFLYNAIHWGGVAELIGSSKRFVNLSLKVGRQRVRTDSSGRLVADPGVITHLVRSIPHALEDKKLYAQVNPRVTGSARLSFGQVFGLLRAASNSLHSIQPVVTEPGRSHINVRLGGNQVVVEDHGLGVHYPGFTQKRGSSTFLQERAAEITRELRANGATTTLRFKRAA